MITAYQCQRGIVIFDRPCARCGAPASVVSPSGKAAYCEAHAKSACGVHSIADYVYCKRRRIWCDPCIALDIDIKQNNLQWSS